MSTSTVLRRYRRDPYEPFEDPDMRQSTIYGPRWPKFLQRDGGLVEMREVQPLQNARRMAQIALDLATDGLGLGRVSLRWYGPVDAWDREEKVRGEADYIPFVSEQKDHGFTLPDYPAEVWLRPDKSLRDIFGTVCHECRHLWQFRNFPLTDYDEQAYRAAAEEDAYGYQASALEWYDATIRKDRPIW